MRALIPGPARLHRHGLVLSISLFVALCVPAVTRAQDAPAEEAPTQQPTADEPGPSPRYMGAIERELDALAIPHVCEAESPTRARCAFQYLGRSTQRQYDLHVVYSDDTDTVYIYVARYLMASAEDESTASLLRRLMEVNWSLLAAKLEWDASSGEVRLAMVMNTDSNFDRRAFRSLIRQLGPLADRYLPELSRLVAE